MEEKKIGGYLQNFSKNLRYEKKISSKLKAKIMKIQFFANFS